MKDIIFYNSERKTVISWTDIECDTQVVSLNICLNYSIYKATLFCKIEWCQIELFHKCLNELNIAELRVPNAFVLEFSDCFNLKMGTDDYGLVSMNFILKDEQDSILDINYQIDQSFIPELIQEIEELWFNKDENLQGRQYENLGIANKSSIRIMDIDVHHNNAPYDSYVMMKLNLNISFFSVNINLTMYIDEFNHFKGDVSLLTNSIGNIDRTVLSPLGEFVSIEICRAKDDFTIKGNIGDLLMPQSDFCFQDVLKKADFILLYNDVCHSGVI